MPAIAGLGGLQVSYEVEHRNSEGKLIYREASIMLPTLPEAPPAPTCPDCIDQYKRELDEWGAECKRLADFYRAVHQYHSARAAYCMRHRHNEIEEKYRTGDPSPSTIQEAESEIRKLRR